LNYFENKYILYYSNEHTNKMNTECPICFEVIEGEKNKVITECGHIFHTNCLMKNVSHNGFGCPYCRSIMAEKQENDSDSDSESDTESEWSEVEDDIEEHNGLEGLRHLFARAEGTYIPPPTAEDINRKMMEKGYTMLDLVKVLLTNYQDDCFSETESEYENQITYVDKVVDDLNEIIIEYENVN
jgi:hypothetical protein